MLAAKAGNTFVHFELQRDKELNIFAKCNACTTEIRIQRISQGTFLMEQHLSTQMHSTNAEILCYRESGMPVDASQLRRKITDKFPDVFLFKKDKICCRTCSFEMILSGRKNIIGNLSLFQPRQRSSRTETASTTGTYGQANTERPLRRIVEGATNCDQNGLRRSTRTRTAYVFDT